MAASHHFILAFLSGFAIVFGQNQEANSAYTEPTSTINYISDAAFIDTGRVHNISTVHLTTDLEQQLRTLRSFPEGLRNCYRVEVVADTKYIIRVSFLYGNYDGENKLPSFDLHLGASFWDSVAFQQTSDVVHKEVIHMVSSNHVEVCVVNNGNGIPFVSALELRPLNNMNYPFVVDGSRSLINFLRLDIGSNNKTFRFKDDVYDRIWKSPDQAPTTAFSYEPDSWTTLQTVPPSSIEENHSYYTAPVVISTAATPRNSSSALEFSWTHPDKTASFFIFLYFAEVIRGYRSRVRRFNIFINGKQWWKKGVLLRSYLLSVTIYSTKGINCVNGTCKVSLVKPNSSIHPPILNALEIYTVTSFSQLDTNEEDVEAMKLIKEKYGVGRNWQGDPCAPQEFIWEGLNCSSDRSDRGRHRIKSLNLSSSGLKGGITHHIANLTMLEILDLSNNSLSGEVPDFFTQLPLLRILKLEKNNFSGVIPSQLIEKSYKGSLSLSFGENPNLFPEVPSRKKEENIVVFVVASISGFVILLLLIGALFFWRFKWRKQGEECDQWETTKRRYSHLDIVRITNKFERILGVGGFGKVYYGRTENIEVAVKMLSSSSTQGYIQFQAEVDLLVRVHHKNLTNLVGYCNESTNKGLVYEYMGRGNLRSLLSNAPPYTLNWKERLHMALGSAQGLEYLHNGIKPAMIHRDVKSTNILLSDHDEVKVSDFGLSRISPTEAGNTHITTANVVGTRGYIDPEYYTSYKLGEKSDVYSYGVVLLEIVTGRAVFKEEEDGEITHIRQWVDSKLSQGDINSIIDSKVNQDFNVNSVLKAIEIAMSCTCRSSMSRPNMSQVVAELKECLVIELGQNQSHPSESTVNDSSVLSPR